jgi:hypothetical protein
MNSPRVKTQRGGDLAATTPKRFNLVDLTPLVCGAQKWCEHANTRVERLANGPHHAKEWCTDCGQILRWMPKPETIERQRYNALHIARLLMSEGLSEWERNFLKSITPLKKLSPRQQACLDMMYTDRLGGATR